MYWNILEDDRGEKIPMSQEERGHGRITADFLCAASHLHFAAFCLTAANCWVVKIQIKPMAGCELCCTLVCMSNPPLHHHPIWQFLPLSLSPLSLPLCLTLFCTSSLFKCHPTQGAAALNYGPSPPPPCHFLNEFMVLWPGFLHSGNKGYLHPKLHACLNIGEGKTSSLPWDYDEMKRRRLNRGFSPVMYVTSSA